MVGSGTVVPEPYRGCSSYYVEAGGVRALLDCGPGAVGSLARYDVPWERLTDLVLSHFHGDHVGALPGLFFALKHGVFPPREEELRVWGPAGTRDLFEGLASALGDYLLDPGFPVEVRELAPGAPATPAPGVELAFAETPHTDESVAIRLAWEEADGTPVRLGYTGDTGPSPGLGEFLEGVDLLVSECSLGEEEVGDNHLSPPRVAELARAAQPGFLLLTHVYPHLREEQDVGSLVAAAGYAGPLELAEDGDSYRLPPA